MLYCWHLGTTKCAHSFQRHIHLANVFILQKSKFNGRLKDWAESLIKGMKHVFIYCQHAPCGTKQYSGIYLVH